MSGGKMVGPQDYMKNYCVCLAPYLVALFNPAGGEVSSYPVTVYNINGVELGTANNKQEYLDLWNADPDDAKIGTLTGAYGPFYFTMKPNINQLQLEQVDGIRSRAFSKGFNFGFQ